MNVVSLDFAKRLADYWPANTNVTDWCYVHRENDEWGLIRREDVVGAPLWVSAPDLGWILRKLPSQIREDGLTHPLHMYSYLDKWRIGYGNKTGMRYMVHLTRPEDAAAKVAIKLFEAGVLTGGQS